MSGSNVQSTSLKRKFLVFSVVLFGIILIGSSIVFFLTLRQIVYTSAGHELEKSMEIERIKLEAAVNAEIAIAVKMAVSPLIIAHFLDPADQALKRIAFDEIEGYRKAFASNIVFWVSDVDREFYFSEDSHYTMDADDPDNYWYHMTLYETEVFNFNINYNPEINTTMLWINAPVFGQFGTPLGLVGSGIDLTNFINDIYTNYTGDAEIYLFNAYNEITGAKDINLIMNKAILDTHLGATGTEIQSLAKELLPYEVRSFSAPDGEVAVGNLSSLGWFIVGILPISLGAVLSNSMTGVFLAMMAVIAGIFLIFYVLIGWMLKPLNLMISALDHISTSWDLTQQLHIKHKDETGILGGFFNTTFGKMKELITGIKAKTVSLSDTGDELALHMSKTKTEIDGINKNIQGMRGQVLSQADMVNATTHSMDNIISGLGKLNEHISVQSESVAQSSSAIEQMLANIQSVTQTLVRNTQNINSLAEAAEASRVDLQKVSGDIQEIAHESESLLQINQVMQTIASQTNLLAMNAAIEAAHAGESGKGFAVVADEIRKLAENSGTQSKTISGVLKKIKSMIDMITRSTASVMERFSAIEQEVQTVSNQETQIRNAMEEQGHGSRQILEAVTQLNTITTQVRKASTDMTDESKDILKQSSDLKRISSDVAGNMDEMTQGVDEIVSTITRVREITEENKGNIDTLSMEVKRFKVD